MGWVIYHFEASSVIIRTTLETFERFHVEKNFCFVFRKKYGIITLGVILYSDIFRVFNYLFVIKYLLYHRKSYCCPGLKSKKITSDFFKLRIKSFQSDIISKNI